MGRAAGSGTSQAGPPPASAGGGARLELRGLRKRYGETRALDGLDLSARAGEVLGIAGPNGAGKSTLVRVLAGEDVEDGGSLTLNGRPWGVAARRREVALVHQEPRLFPTLTVAENLLVGAERTTLLRPRAGGREAEISTELGLAGVIDSPVEECSLVTQQLAEIARAILRDATAFLFDEPNSALTAEESERLFGHIQRLRAEGNCVVMLITHRLADLVANCDRVAVVRNGRVAVMFEGEELTTANLGQAIAGTWERGGAADAPAAAQGAARAVRRDGERPLLSARGWSDRAGAFHDIDVDVHPGEALLITGQEGAGGRELVRSLAGLRAARGTLEIADAGERRRALCYVPADRAVALFQNFSVAGNLATRLGRGSIAGWGGYLRVGSIMRRGARLVERLRIHTSSARAPIGSLSGGNQQKVSVGSALAAGPRVLLIEEPTRGVDVETKKEIYTSLRSYVADGNAVIAFSPELDDVFHLGDTVRVVTDGRLSEPLDIGGLSGLDQLAAWVDRVATEARRGARAHGGADVARARQGGAR